MILLFSIKSKYLLQKILPCKITGGFLQTEIYVKCAIWKHNFKTPKKNFQAKITILKLTYSINSCYSSFIFLRVRESNSKGVTIHIIWIKPESLKFNYQGEYYVPLQNDNIVHISQAKIKFSSITPSTITIFFFHFCFYLVMKSLESQ